MKCFKMRKLVAALGMTGCLIFSSEAMASAFQLWEQDAASVGNYHAGYAAAAYDASTAFYNPAGLNRFKEQQFVLAADNIFTSFKYQGTINVNTLGGGVSPQAATVNGGNYGFVPAMHYVAPLSDVVAFGLSVDVPFGLKVSYGKQSLLRYASTTSSVRVVDVSPVLSFQVTDKVSVGLGPDIQMMKGVFNQVGVFGDDSDSDGINSADGTGYGMHAGGLYQFNENSRIGLSYHSQVVHHLSGNSTFSGPIADFFGVPIQSSRATVNLTLPAYTALSGYHKLNTRVAVMGSVIFTQWNTIQNLVLRNVAGVEGLIIPRPSTNIVATLPMHFHNTFNFSVGADYIASDTITLRGGLGYDQTPVSNTYRNVQLPDNNRFALAIGGHIQSTPTLGFDLGWTHLMMNKAHVIPPAQVVGIESVTTNGSVTGGADVLAAQLVWDMV